MKHKHTIAIFLIAFAYFTILAAKQYTWIFVSGDSGDWLANSITWFVPQPLGSPLFVFAGQFLNLFPGDQVLKMTILLSCLPSAVTVALVHMSTTKITGTRHSGIVAAVILLGAAIFLTQSTVLEQYALAIMFLVMAYWFYLNGQRKLTMMALGLSAGVHIVALPIGLLWLWIEKRNWRAWLKVSWVFVIFGVLPYIMVPILMMQHRAPVIAGYWSFENLFRYMFTVSGVIIGQLSVFDFPKRFGLWLAYLLVCMGLALVPVLLSLKRPIPKEIQVAGMIAAFSLWYYLCNLDPGTWPFFAFAMPFLAIMAGVGLSRMKPIHVRAVTACALMLLVANAAFLNADAINAQNRTAVQVKETFENLPYGSAVLSNQGAYMLCLMWVRAESRPDLVPIIWADIGEEGATQGYLDYTDWIEQNFGIVAHNGSTMVKGAFDQGRPIFIAETPWRTEEGIGKTQWQDFIEFEATIEGEGRIRSITNVELLDEASL